jgi:hypothetical protein
MTESLACATGFVNYTQVYHSHAILPRACEVDIDAAQATIAAGILLSSQRAKLSYKLS